MATSDDFSFLMFAVAVLGMAARYVTPWQKRRHGVEFDEHALEALFLATSERHLLRLLEESNTFAVGFLDLLASHYLFNRKTRRAFVLMGMSMRVAQGMELHNEPNWPEITVEEREMRRRLWWSLYTSEK